MSAVILWVLMVMAPNEAAGRQLGPFLTEADCRTAEAIYNEQMRRYVGRPSACVRAGR